MAGTYCTEAQEVKEVSLKAIPSGMRDLPSALHAIWYSDYPLVG